MVGLYIEDEEDIEEEDDGDLYIYYKGFNGTQTQFIGGVEYSIQLVKDENA